MEEVRRGLELARRISDSPGPQRTSSPKPRSSPYASPSITPPGSRRPSHDLSLPLAVRPTPKSPVDVPDCAICASPMEDPAVGGGCAHHFCLPCYKEWAARKASCPTCRAPVWSLVVDVEYAKMCGAEVTQSQAKTKTKLVGDDNDDSAEAEQGQPGCRTVPVDYPAGMTIGNSNRGGCLVVKVVKGNGAHRAGIRAGDVLVKVNGTEVRLACLQSASSTQHWSPFIHARTTGESLHWDDLRMHGPHA